MIELLLPLYNLYVLHYMLNFYIISIMNRGLMHLQIGRNALLLMEESKYNPQPSFPFFLYLSFIYELSSSIFFFLNLDRYYYNKVTKQSKWKIPDELKVFSLFQISTIHGPLYTFFFFFTDLKN